jgi:hypothetical protein
MYHASIFTHQFISISTVWAVAVFATVAILDIWMIILLASQAERIRHQNATIYRFHQEKTKLYDTFMRQVDNTIAMAPGPAISDRLRKILDDLALGRKISAARTSDAALSAPRPAHRMSYEEFNRWMAERYPEIKATLTEEEYYSPQIFHEMVLRLFEGTI